MTSKHTPGPWAVVATKPDGEYKNLIKVGPEGGFEPFGGCGCCGSPWMEGEDEDEQTANARLIAAAPDMLEVLLFLRNNYDVGDVVDPIIAKATGE